MIRIFNQLVSLKTVLLIQVEGLLIFASFVAATKLWFWKDPAGFTSHTRWPLFFAQCAIQLALLLACFYYSGLYSIESTRNRLQQLIALTRSIGALWFISAALSFLAPSLAMGRGVMILALLLTLLSVITARLVWDKLWRAAAPRRKVLLLGNGATAEAVAREIFRREDLSLSVFAFAAKTSKQAGGRFLGRPLLDLAKMAESVTRVGVSHIIVALERDDELPVADLMNLRLRGVSIDSAHEVLAALSGRIWLEAISPSDVIFKDGYQFPRFTQVWKRALDLFFGVSGILVTSPLMALTALAVWLDSGRPILYRQSRTGLYGKEFQLLKFRSMRIDAEPNGEPQWARLKDPRVTRVGAFLRAYRLDELPQFLNVVRGHMSFVGPRPERPSFVTQLRCQIPFYDARHSIRPGVTGWAQVEYKYGRTIADAVRKLEYDLFYVKNMSFAFDCAIALKTLRIVLLGWGDQ